MGRCPCWCLGCSPALRGLQLAATWRHTARTLVALCVRPSGTPHPAAGGVMVGYCVIMADVLVGSAPAHGGMLPTLLARANDPNKCARRGRSATGPLPSPCRHGSVPIAAARSAAGHLPLCSLAGCTMRPALAYAILHRLVNSCECRLAPAKPCRPGPRAEGDSAMAARAGPGPVLLPWPAPACGGCLPGSCVRCSPCAVLARDAPPALTAGPCAGN